MQEHQLLFANYQDFHNSFQLIFHLPHKKHFCLGFLISFSDFIFNAIKRLMLPGTSSVTLIKYIQTLI